MSQWSFSDQDRISGATVEADWNGIIIRGMQSFDISDEVTRDPMYGNGAVSIGMPQGTHKAEATLVSIPEEVDEVLQALGPNFYLVPGTIGITLVRASGPITYNLTRVYLNKGQVKFEAGAQKGSEGTLTAVVLDPIDWNGLTGTSPAPTGIAFSFPFDVGF